MKFFLKLFLIQNLSNFKKENALLAYDSVNQIVSICWESYNLGPAVKNIKKPVVFKRNLNV